jgi:hypothetical protein
LASGELFCSGEGRIAKENIFEQAQVELGGIVVSLQMLGDENQGFRIPAHHVPFLSSGEPDVVLHCHHGPIPRDLLDGDLLFSNNLWSLHRKPQGFIWRQTPLGGGDPQRLGVFSPDFSSGELYVAPLAQGREQWNYPLYHPVDKFLLATILADRRGVTCHACGVDDRRSGLLFVGESGAGKSTMAELWNGRPGVTVLSDERTIVRWHRERFHLFGTPWYGTAEIVSPAHVPLSVVFFLRHGSENQVTPLDRGQVIKRLLVRTYLPFWSASGIDRSLQLFDELSQAVPCYELAYVPGEDVIGFLRGVVGSTLPG